MLALRQAERLHQPAQPQVCSSCQLHVHHEQLPLHHLHEWLSSTGAPKGGLWGLSITQLDTSMRGRAHTVSWWPARDAFAGGES